jgi:hypothetical protein
VTVVRCYLQHPAHLLTITPPTLEAQHVHPPHVVPACAPVPHPCCCLQAALGYVSEQTEGFVDFDAVPAEGASAAEVLSFVLGPEARELRPLLTGWLAGAADLVLRDRCVGGVDGGGVFTQ